MRCENGVRSEPTASNPYTCTFAAVSWRSRSAVVSDPSILSDASGGGLTSSRMSVPFGMSTSAPAAGSFPSGQLAVSDQRFALGCDVAPTGLLSVGSGVSSREHAAPNEMIAETATTAATRRVTSGEVRRRLADRRRAARRDIRSCSKAQATSAVSALRRETLAFC